jgi:hypothetical protein
MEKSESDGMSLHKGQRFYFSFWRPVRIIDRLRTGRLWFDSRQGRGRDAFSGGYRTPGLQAGHLL